MAPDLGKAVSEAKAGKIEYRLDKQNIIHVPVGKASFGAEKLYTNLDTVMELLPSKARCSKGYLLQERYHRHHHGPWHPSEHPEVRCLI